MDDRGSLSSRMARWATEDVEFEQEVDDLIAQHEINMSSEIDRQEEYQKQLDDQQAWILKLVMDHSALMASMQARHEAIREARATTSRRQILSSEPTVYHFSDEEGEDVDLGGDGGQRDDEGNEDDRSAAAAAQSDSPSTEGLYDDASDYTPQTAANAAGGERPHSSGSNHESSTHEDNITSDDTVLASKSNEERHQRVLSANQDGTREANTTYPSRINDTDNRQQYHNPTTAPPNTPTIPETADAFATLALLPNYNDTRDDRTPSPRRSSITSLDPCTVLVTGGHNPPAPGKENVILITAVLECRSSSVPGAAGSDADDAEDGNQGTYKCVLNDGSEKWISPHDIADPERCKHVQAYHDEHPEKPRPSDRRGRAACVYGLDGAADYDDDDDDSIEPAERRRRRGATRGVAVAAAASSAAAE